MNEAAWMSIIISLVAVLLTAAIHMGIAAQQRGRYLQKVDGLAAELKEHKELSVGRAHAKEG